MAITDIQISDELQTNAPSIKYRGNEGPKAPMEMAMADPMLIEEYQKYVYSMQEQGQEPVSFEQFVQEIMSGMAEGGRVPAAFGGIMDSSTGRKRYGIGSKLKRAVRKIIPNEVARVAEVAAPFVAPFNPLIGGAMAGLGGFDRHGSLGKGLRSGLMTYGLGNVARYAGGAGPQWGLKAPGAGTGFGSYFTTPVGAETGIGKMLSDRKAPADMSMKPTVSDAQKSTQLGQMHVDTGDTAFVKKPMDIVAQTGSAVQENVEKEGILKTVIDNVKNAKMSTKAMMGILGVSSLAGLMSAMEQPETMESPDRGVGLPGGISGIREEVIEAMKDPSGEKLKAIRIKYPFLGAQETKNLNLMAKGGPAKKKKKKYKRQGMEFDYPLGPEGTFNTLNPPKRYEVAEGGIMDLDGMEKDYRNEGGFVPIGEKEKADDVPARLSVNEFVMTADAVRGMGDGDIDLGAERMEDLMETLEDKNKRQQGASDMFEVSERLSAVV